MTSGSRSSSLGDELRLPRAPGVFRRFWARHPVFADILITGLCLLFSLVPVSAFDPPNSQTTGRIAASPATAAVVVSIVVLGCFALLLRRRLPTTVFVASVVVAHAYLLAPLPIGGPLLFVTTYSMAVYRSTRACLIGGGIALGSLYLNATVLGATGAAAWSVAGNTMLGETIAVVIGSLIGANVGNRKRYVDALIAYSRRLIIERDQQSQLAAASERDRIARELHDIVAHSLTVMVALAEGVAASTDIDRSRPGAVAIATTGREALRDMRATLGVLRDAEAAPLAPLVRDTTAETIASARAAGFDARLTVVGDAAGTSAGILLALSRIVQESVTNAMRHGRSVRRIDVTVSYTADEVAVRVDDDGDPVPPTNLDTGSGGFGLRGVRERVELAGGTVEAGPRRVRGWTVSARLPRTEEDA